MKRIQAIVVVMSLGVLGAVGCDSGEKAGKEKAGAKADGAKPEPAKTDPAEKKTEVEPAAVPDKVADAVVDGDAPTEAAPPSAQEVLETLDKRVTRVAKLAEQIEAKPENADQILEAAELDREEFEALIFAIGADPDLSKQYQLARAGE